MDQKIRETAAHCASLRTIKNVITRLAAQLRAYADQVALLIRRRFDVNPSLVTACGVALSFAAAALVTTNVRMSATLLLLAGVADLMDGALARTREPNPLGATIDTLADRVADVAVFFGLAASSTTKSHSLIVLAAAAMSLLVPYIAAIADTDSRRSPRSGPAPRGVRVVLVALAIVVVAWRYELLLLVVALSLVTAAVRLDGIFRQGPLRSARPRLFVERFNPLLENSSVRPAKRLRSRTSHPGEPQLALRRIRSTRRSQRLPIDRGSRGK